MSQTPWKGSLEDHGAHAVTWSVTAGNLWHLDAAFINGSMGEWCNSSMLAMQSSSDNHCLSGP